MSKADDFERRAVEADKKADQARTPEIATTWREVAQRWRDMARQLDRQER
jgi:hypothetical protein